MTMTAMVVTMAANPLREGLVSMVVRAVDPPSGVDPPDFTETPFWTAFWIAAGVILVVVVLVGAIIALVTRIEQQATETRAHLVAGKHATAPFQDLVELSVHLRALARVVRAAPSPRSEVRR